MSINIRMPNLNLSVISGNLTRDPRINETKGGKKVMSFDIAHNDGYMDKNKEWQNKVSYVPVVVMGKLAEIMSNKLFKGSPVIVEGKLQLHRWTGRDGTKKQRIEIWASSIQAIEKTSYNEEPPTDQYDQEGGGGKDNEPPEYDDDVPFS